MKKHILFIVENNAVPWDLRVWNEAQAAREFGFEVTVVCPQNEKAPLRFETIDGIDVYRHYTPFEAVSKRGFMVEYGNALLWEFLLSFWVFLKKPFHYIHAANPPDHIFLIGLFFKIFGVRFIFDHHDICPENYVAKFEKKDLFYRLLLLMEKLTFKTADLVISTNESYKKIAITRGSRHPDDVFVVRNGPDLSRITFMPPNHSLKDGFDYLVGYIGGIGSQECLDVLLRAVSHIVHEKGITNVKFIVIGRGPDLGNMITLSGKMKLTKYVTFTGFIPYKEVYEILATSDLCVNPEPKNSFTDKSTMIKIMDYMVFGKPIVQFDTTEGRVTAGESSIYVENNDEIAFAEAIVSLLNDLNKRQQMCNIAKKRIGRSLNWNKQKANLRKAYDSLWIRNSLT